MPANSDQIKSGWKGGGLSLLLLKVEVRVLPSSPGKYAYGYLDAPPQDMGMSTLQPFVATYMQHKKLDCLVHKVQHITETNCIIF